MATTVLGAGVIGIATAYWLARAGEDVTVIDRCAEPAGETSHANAGMITPSQSWPWATPAFVGIFAQAIIGRSREVRIAPFAALQAADWGIAFLRRANRRDGRRSFLANLALSRTSQNLMAEIRDDLALAYDRTDVGTLRLYFSGAAAESGEALAGVLRDEGLDTCILTAEECMAREPALSPLRGSLAGGLLASGDETGDCAAFTQGTANALAARGVRFRYTTEIERIELLAGRGIRILTDEEPELTDRCIVAAGNGSAELLAPLGIRLPINPVKGYSLTLALADGVEPLRLPLIDEARAVGLTPMGRRLRIGGFIDVAGRNEEIRLPMVAHMRRVAEDLLPDVVRDATEIERWACRRPMTPDGPPIIGPTPVPGLFVNTGHGSTGWTMAAGSGRLAADLVLGSTPALDPSPYSPTRF